MIGSNIHVGKIPKGELGQCRDNKEGWKWAEELDLLTLMDLPVSKLWSPTMSFSDEMKVRILDINVLVWESCTGPHGWCTTQLCRLSAPQGAAVQPPCWSPGLCRKVELIRCRDGAIRRNSRKGKDPALLEDKGVILKLNSPCNNKITLWCRLKYYSDDLCL